MTRMANVFCTLGIMALLLGACSKGEEAGAPKSDETADDKAAMAAGEGDKAAQADGDKAPAGDEAAAQADDDAGHIKVYARHVPSPETDPVEIAIQKFTVVSAELDPANLEGATAELELDLSSIDSGVEKRNMHLQTPDYLDVAKFGNAKVKIGEVEKGEGENVYSAQAEVAAHGVTKAFPVSFEVIETTEDSVRVKAEHTFSRLDFGIGKEPDGENEKVAKDLTVEMELTLKNTK